MIVSHRYESRRLKLLAAQVVGATVLDIGNARLPNPYLPTGTTVGFDRSEPARGKPRYDEQITGDVGDITNILGDRRFDTIICGELVEHIEQPHQLLRSLKAHIKKGGRLVLSTPNPLGFPAILYELARSKRRFYAADHVHSFAPRWVERMLHQCDYQVAVVKPVGLWLPGFVIPGIPVALSHQVIYVALPET